MNPRPSGLLLLCKAIAGYLNYKNAEGLSFRTIDSHEQIFIKWLEHNGKNPSACCQDLE
jgi:integrase/recombinase XerD